MLSSTNNNKRKDILAFKILILSVTG